MGRCPRCGVDTGPFGGLCDSCRTRESLLRDKALRDQAERYNRDREKNKQSSNTKITYVPMDSTVANVIIALVVIALLLGASWWVITSYQHKSAEMSNEVMSETYHEDGSFIVSEVLTRDDQVGQWEISVTDHKKGFLGTLFNLKGNTARIKRYLQKDGTEVIHFDLDGYDFETELNGEYYIVTIDGIVSVIDDEEELIYQKGSSFFDTYYPKLKALTYDKILTSLQKNMTGAQYGKNNEYEHILQANAWQMKVVDENRVIFTYDTKDVFTQYVCDVSDLNNDYTFELRNYKMANASDSLDELGQLLAEADYSSSIEIYDDLNEIVDIRYERNGKEHNFEFKNNYGDFIGGTYYSYVLNKETKTIVYRYFSDEAQKWVDEIPKNASSMYQELVAFIPETYVRKVIDLDKAKKDGFIITTYTMKNKDKETTAILSLLFGKINKLIHYREDGKRIEIAW